MLKNEDIEVFKIASKNRVDFMMMAHLLVEDFDSDFPISLSKTAHDFLVKELNFRGLIISDDMEMGAITKNFGAVESAELALTAGSHLVEYRSFENCNDVVEKLNKKCEVNSELRDLLSFRSKTVLKK